MKYREFTEMMLRFADEVESICQFRDTAAYDVECKDDSELQNKEDILILTELFDLDSFVKAVRYYNNKRIVQGYISLENDKPMFMSDDLMLISDDTKIQLHDTDFIEYGIKEEDGEPSYNPDDIYFYQIEQLKELYKLDKLDGLQVQIRV